MRSNPNNEYSVAQQLLYGVKSPFKSTIALPLFRLKGCLRYIISDELSIFMPTLLELEVYRFVCDFWAHSMGP